VGARTIPILAGLVDSSHFVEATIMTYCYIDPTLQLAIQFAASLLGGGLAGAGVSVASNRRFY
jgi:hypothetical protein